MRTWRTQMPRFGVIGICIFVYITLSSLLQDLTKAKKTPDKTDKNDQVVCNIPKLDPFNPAMRVKGRHEFPRCDGSNDSESYPLIFTTDFENHIIIAEHPNKYGYNSCCYQSILRDGDRRARLSQDCVQLTASETNVPADVEHIAVECTNSSNGDKVIVDAFGFVHQKPEVEKRILDLGKKPQPSSLNVVMLTIDSVSHMQLMRDLPKFYDYLTKNLTAIGMNGYVKVGENTLPNLVPILAGLNLDQLADTCWKGPDDFFDDCPFIWKEFSDRGYRTSYMEDCNIIGTFNYMKAGFQNSPVDYYLRPLMIFMENNLKPNDRACKGPRPRLSAPEILLDQMERMAWTLRRVGKYFQFAVTATLTHDKMEEAPLLDDVVLKTFKFFNDNGFLNRTLYILMSDHGYRMGAISDSLQGRTEDRMPFLYFVFPHWFIDLYPQAIENLRGNRERLTTPYDLHETLKDIMEMADGNFHSEHMDSSKKNVSRGISLFQKVPPNRTCSMAGIKLAFCVCSELIPIQNIDGFVKEAANTFIERTNLKLISRMECQELSLKRVINAFDVRVNSSNGGQENPDMQTLLLTLETIPGGGRFEVTVSRRRPLGLLMNDTWNLTTVSRINRYGNQSHCTNELDLKIYCVCRDTNWVEWIE